MYGLIMKDAASIPTLEIKSIKDEVKSEKILVILPVSFLILSIKNAGIIFICFRCFDFKSFS